jgi:type I restriction enzyme S subunit
MEKYQSYKPSGVEWIGEIPENWRISKFKYVSKLYTGNSLNDEQKVLYESDNENHIPYVSSKDIDINTRNVNYNNGLRIPKENNPLKVSPKDSFLLCVEGGSSGRKMVYLDREVCFVNKLCSFKSVENTRFQFYFIQSSNFQDKFRLSLSGLIGGVSISTLRDFELVLPSIQEQHHIVQFLDKKTDLIDKLISTKERKITLLKEQRTSLINQVVTKGLNPNVKMKGSGVEWIGEIPEMWIISKLKYNGVFFSGYSFDSGDFISEGEIRVIKISNIQNNGISWDDLSFVPTEFYDKFKNFIVQKGDLIFVLTRPIISTGIKICFYDEDYRVLLNQRNSVYRPNSIKLNKIFTYYLVRTMYFFEEFKQQLKETNQPNISTEQISNIKIFLPPIEEQLQIVEYLDSKTKEIDDLVQLEQKKIDLLKEYRQSLISEVVTGKIKVTTDE